VARPRKRKDDVIVVKKYANRRLYDTGRSSYVTLDDLCDMIKEGRGVHRYRREIRRRSDTAGSDSNRNCLMSMYFVQLRIAPKPQNPKTPRFIEMYIF